MYPTTLCRFIMYWYLICLLVVEVIYCKSSYTKDSYLQSQPYHYPAQTFALLDTVVGKDVPLSQIDYLQSKLEYAKRSRHSNGTEIQHIRGIINRSLNSRISSMLSEEYRTYGWPIAQFQICLPFRWQIISSYSILKKDSVSCLWMVFYSNLCSCCAIQIGETGHSI